MTTLKDYGFTKVLPKKLNIFRLTNAKWPKISILSTIYFNHQQVRVL